jgi:hypothetical protein
MNIDKLVRDADPAALITIPDPPHVAAIAALGRASQRRRRRRLGAGITAGTAAAAAVLGLGLTGTFGPATGTGAIRTSAPARGTGTVRTVAFTLAEHVNGTATLTIDLRVLLDAATLQADLQQHGIPALVTAGSFCSSRPSPAGISQVMPGGKSSKPIFQRSPQLIITINPAAIPVGTKLSFGSFRLSPGAETMFGLIYAKSHTCTSTTPVFVPPPGADAMVVWNPGGPNAAAAKAATKSYQNERDGESW